jgi:hypothetical protein
MIGSDWSWLTNLDRNRTPSFFFSPFAVLMDPQRVAARWQSWHLQERRLTRHQPFERDGRHAFELTDQLLHGMVGSHAQH